MRFVRVNSLTLKVENVLLGDESFFKNRPDYDMWIQSDTANILDTYNSATGAFTSLPPFSSWTFNETTYRWEAPVAYPDDGKLYDWDEDTTNWIEIT